MKAAGITLSTVGAGGGSNPFLEGLAKQGGGRFYDAANPASIPDIFLKETQQVSGEQIVDRLCPLADIITPNHFEFEWLCGAKAATIDQVLKAARAFMARGDGRRHQRRAGRHA